MELPKTSLNQFEPMNLFEQKLAANGQTLNRAWLETLQINVGRKCNQACHHCHVEAAPWRTEMMNARAARRIGGWITSHRPKTVDLTGGAPELSEHFRYLVETSRSSGCRVIDRSNLTIIEAQSHNWLAEYLAFHEVEVVASLPCYLEANVNAQRGEGVFEKSIRALKKLNALGYGSRLPLNLVLQSSWPQTPPRPGRTGSRLQGRTWLPLRRRIHEPLYHCQPAHRALCRRPPTARPMGGVPPTPGQQLQSLHRPEPHVPLHP